MMRLTDARLEGLGREMHDLARALFPIHRSMAGPGVRESLHVLQELVPLEVHEIATGTPVFDWTVPQEWQIRDAFIKDSSGNRLVDYRASNLHVFSHSQSVRARMGWSELKSRLATLPEHPDWVPYRTCYFREDWGFCLSQRQYLELEQRGEVEYDVCIDAEFSDGSLSYGELFVPGLSAQEVLFSCHVCHPSLANDNLSGIAVATYLARELLRVQPRLSYRFVFVPATIGSLAWLSLNETKIGAIRHGLVLALLGDPGPITYKRSRRGDLEIDRATSHVLARSGRDHSIIDFQPFGYDERQYCSPGFDLPIGCLMRSPNGQYDEYHTSADDLTLVRPECLADSLSLCLEVVELLEENRVFVNQNPRGEPRLGRWGLYTDYGSDQDQHALQRATMWVLNLADGTHSLLDVAERSGLDFGIVCEATKRLVDCKLLRESEFDSGGGFTPRDGTAADPAVGACGVESAGPGRSPR